MHTEKNPKSIAAERALSAVMAVADAAACRGAYLRRFDDSALATARAQDQMAAAGVPLPALAGRPVSVKDLFDVAGFPTTGASASLADAAPADADCPAVARLRAAGALVTGHTHLTEFAFSGVGINPHHATPVNPATAALDATPRVPGGSTSGGAVTVATGAAWAALGSDTGGSIRIPAALQGLVGFKNTQALTPLAGAIPLSTTLDTACAITRSVADAITVHGVLAARTPLLRGRRLADLRLAVPRTLMLDGLEAPVAAAFERALRTLAARGARIEELMLPEIADVSELFEGGGFSAAESWAWHRERLAARGDRYDPRVALRIRRGEGMSAATYLGLHARRARWIARMAIAMAGFDAMVSPTVPLVAPPMAPLLPGSAEADERFFAVNALLLRNPSVVNQLDGCAISLPCQAAGELPVGLMLWAGALADDTVLDAALAIEAALDSARREGR